MPFSPGARRIVQLRDVELAGQAQGDILYRDASLWKKLAAVSGQFLKSQGPGLNVVWAPISVVKDIDGRSWANGAAGTGVGASVGSEGEYTIASVTLTNTAPGALVGVGMAQHVSGSGNTWGYRLYLDNIQRDSVGYPASAGFVALSWVGEGIAAGTHTLELRMFGDPGMKAPCWVAGRGVVLAAIKAQ